MSMDTCSVCNHPVDTDASEPYVSDRRAGEAVCICEPCQQGPDATRRAIDEIYDCAVLWISEDRFHPSTPPEDWQEAKAHIDALEARVTALEVADINLDSAEDLLAFHVGSEEVLAAGGCHVIVMNAEDFATALEAVRTARAALKRGEG